MKQVLTVLALGVAIVGTSAPAFAQRPASRRGAAAPAAAAPAAAPVPAPVPALAPAPAPVPAVVAPTAPRDPRATIALFGEDQVRNSQPWMRSTLAAVFENKLVQTRRFRVVSMVNRRNADAATTDAARDVFDPSEVIRLGKQVQARYALVLKQIRAERKTVGIGPLKRDELSIMIQAQVQDLQTNLLSESINYDRTIKTGLKPANNAGTVALAEADFGTPYTQALEEFADQFITTAATSLMPLETVVAAITPTQVILEAGSELGLAAGSEFEVWKEGDVITLSSGRQVAQTSKVARVRIDRVDAEISYAQLTETFDERQTRDATPNPARVSKGMIARFAPTVAVPAGKKK